MMPAASKPDRFGASMAAFGALWGAAEITVGSFLHSLHLPLAGTALAVTGAALLAAQRQLHPWRGLTLATAAVASLCKSVSPGGAVLGPMLGILVEGALMELALMAAPRSAPTAALGGVLCALWALGQKFLMQYLLYGGTIFDLYLALLRKAGDALRVEASAGARLAALVLLPFVLAGAAGGLLGRKAGRRAALLVAEAP